jgi:hypothetical protein
MTTNPTPTDDDAPTGARTPADLRLTPRDTGAWELACGLPLDQFPQSYMGALVRWKRAKDGGHAVTIDEALDTDWATIAAEQMGGAEVNPTPGASATPIRKSSKASKPSA